MFYSKKISVHKTVSRNICALGSAEYTLWETLLQSVLG